MKNINLLPLSVSAFAILLLGLAASFPVHLPPQLSGCFSWQAVIRDVSGTPIVNRALRFEIAIIQDDGSGSGNGITVYQESHQDTTSQFGLVNLQIGCGELISGDIGNLDWGASDYWLSIQGNPEGGMLTPLGKSRILGAPWSSWAEHSGDWVNVGDTILYRLKGNVGIGIDNPVAPLEIALGGGVLIHASDDPTKTEISFISTSDGTPVDIVNSVNNAPTIFYNRFNLDTRERVRIGANGYVGIGTEGGANAPLEIALGGGIHIHSSSILNEITFIQGGSSEGDAADIVNSVNNAPFIFHTKSNGNTGERVRITPEGFVGIGTATPNFPLDVNGVTRTKVLEITGGSDLTEGFEVRLTEECTPAPGLLVSIDPDHPGELMVTTEPYDKKLAGIISGANGVQPGMKMGQKGTIADGEYPVTLTGRVYVKADAAFGAIQPGDLLTSSSVPGYAMKVQDYGRAQGAVIGKAMTELKEGRAFVLVLVALQ